MPVRIISAMDSNRPALMSSRVISISKALMWVSHSCKGASSLCPRSRLIPAWVCALISPGATTRPVAEMSPGPTGPRLGPR